jgi:hypothetical protein
MRLPRLFAAAALLVLAGCGGAGGGAGATAQGLAYANPANAQGQFALVLDAAASSGSTLVLDLVGPAATPAVGVTFGFNLDTTRAAWAATPVSNGTLFTLGAGTQLARGWVDGPSLQGIVSNKGLASQVADIGSAQGVIARIELTAVPGAPAGAVSLVDNGLGTVLDSSGQSQPIQVQVGALTIN